MYENVRRHERLPPGDTGNCPPFVIRRGCANCGYYHDRLSNDAVSEVMKTPDEVGAGERGSRKSRQGQAWIYHMQMSGSVGGVS